MPTIHLQCEGESIPFELSDDWDIRGMSEPSGLLDGADAIPNALLDAIGTPPLGEIAREKLETNPDAEAVIVVSDNTRPVPYRGNDGLMVHLLNTLLNAGYEQDQITVLIGAGSHRNMEPDEIEEMLGLREQGFDEVHVENHEYANDDQLVDLGTTEHGTPALVNKRYVEADLKIVTGLVESHFMAGASGGRKGICPAIAGKETLTSFHGAEPMSSPNAVDLTLENNPLHRESLAVAHKAGCDFIVNVTIDNDERLTGVFAGDLEEAHDQAVERIREYVTVDLDKRYDVVLVPGRFVAVNHYQAAKAAVEASRAVKQDGHIVLVADNTDPDPIGGEGYKKSLEVFMDRGTDGFRSYIHKNELIQEQWQVQKWANVFDQIGGPEHLLYCATQIPVEAYDRLPGRAGIKLLSDQERSEKTPEEQLRTMVERSIEQALEECASVDPDLLYLEEGPYGIPQVTDRRKQPV
jgi:nickel-dependent lactate racemase